MPFLFGSGEYMPKRKVSSCLATLPSMYLSREIHSAPPESFVARLSEVIRGFKSLQKMASFWVCVVTELRRLWYEEQPIPHVQLEADPDLNSCLLHQQLQLESNVKLGVGKQEQDDFFTSGENVQRRKLEVEQCSFIYV